jgi:hypothetical protein
MKKEGKHIHRWKRVKHPRRKDLFVCSDPDCNSRSSKNYLEGKRAQCPYCEKTYIITNVMLRKLQTLHCDACTMPRGARSGDTAYDKDPELTDAVGDLLSEILKGNEA